MADVEEVEAVLDGDELVRLALVEIERQETGKALAHLKLALERSPDRAVVHHLLGAAHAEIGLVDRGIREMQRAVELDPGLVQAHFQIGLLQLHRGRVEEARVAWQALAGLPPDHALARFAAGLLDLVAERVETGIAALEAGIRRNDFNQALNRLMRRVIETAREAPARPATGAAAQEPAAGTAPVPVVPRVVLARYESGEEAQ